jgi:hypothetical protein
MVVLLPSGWMFTRGISYCLKHQFEVAFRLATVTSQEGNPLNAFLLYSYELHRNNFLAWFIAAELFPFSVLGTTWNRFPVDL